ncbi:hypothetical protein AB0E01_22980 [Nocardia vinacea]|uniref:hypothetical protein n=1 Tax=Nocardia vinacea TaxID=96468 RepID=UPI00340687BA
MLVNVTLTNEDQGIRFSEWSEDVDDEVTRGEIFRNARSEFGRCVGKVYVDTDSGSDEVGWIFESRQLYDGRNSRNETYIRHAWVTVKMRTYDIVVDCNGTGHAFDNSTAKCIVHPWDCVGRCLRLGSRAVATSVPSRGSDQL